MPGIVDAHVLHDRPPRFFGPTPVDVRHALFLRLKPQLDAWGIEARYSQATGVRVAANETPFTVTDPRTGLPTLRPETERAVLVMSSTSWTEDEDFGLLLDALVAVDRRWAGGTAAEDEHEGGEGAGPRRRSLRGAGSSSSSGSKASLRGVALRPFLVVAVTGKGPLKAHYEARIRALRLRRVAVCTLWLEAADYPLLVGSADLGVCLHESTSGIDLPMKVLDMFGAGLPVCALRFRCLAELVRDQVSEPPRALDTFCMACSAFFLFPPPRITDLFSLLQSGHRRTASSSAAPRSWRGHSTPCWGAFRRARRSSLTASAPASRAWPAGRRTGRSTRPLSCATTRAWAPGRGAGAGDCWWCCWRLHLGWRPRLRNKKIDKCK
jgi:beta-1,4-mannosyltransferase